MDRKKSRAQRLKAASVQIMFREHWFKDPELEGWMCRVDGDPTRVYCKFCAVLIRSHRGDLARHFRRTKHKMKAEQYKAKADSQTTASSSSSSSSAKYKEMFISDNVVQGKILSEIKRKERAAQYMEQLILRNQKRAAKQRKPVAAKNVVYCFKPSWMEDIRLKDWVVECKEDISTVKCSSCCVMLRAHKTDLLRHWKTTKHEAAHYRVTGKTYRDYGFTNEKERRRNIDDDDVNDEDDDDDGTDDATEDDSDESDAEQPKSTASRQPSSANDWASHERYAWLTALPGRPAMGWCTTCNVNIRYAHVDANVHLDSAMHARLSECAGSGTSNDLQLPTALISNPAVSQQVVAQFPPTTQTRRLPEIEHIRLEMSEDNCVLKIEREPFAMDMTTDEHVQMYNNQPALVAPTAFVRPAAGGNTATTNHQDPSGNTADLMAVVHTIELNDVMLAAGGNGGGAAAQSTPVVSATAAAAPPPPPTHAAIVSEAQQANCAVVTANSAVRLRQPNQTVEGGHDGANQLLSLDAADTDGLLETCSQFIDEIDPLSL